MQANQTVSSIEAKARRAAMKCGLVARKSRRNIGADNFGDFMLIDPAGNYVVAGWDYDMTPEDVIEFCK